MLHEQDNILFGVRSQARLESPVMSFQELSDFLDMVREVLVNRVRIFKIDCKNSPDIKTFWMGYNGYIKSILPMIVC